MTADLMRMVAIRIIACFASFPQFAQTPQMQSFIEPLIDNISFFTLA